MPWSSSYAVLSRPYGDRYVRTEYKSRIHSLFSSGDFEIIKGDESDFELLSRNGYNYVRIDPFEIPVNFPATHLSGGFKIQNDTSVSNIIGLVSNTTVTNYIQGLQNFGTRYWNNASRDTVARWIRSKFLETGISDVVIDSFQYAGTWQKNVIATIPGTVLPAAQIIVGGHHDATSSNVLLAP